jgi:hypothetical protein
MRNGRFYPSKCRAIGVLYIHPPKMLGPSPNFLKTQNKKIEGIRGLRGTIDC